MTSQNPATPRTLDDIILGEEFPCGEFSLTREEIIAFAEQFDPQPWHLTDEGAASSYFETLCASGLHSQGAAINLTVRTIKGLEIVAGGSLHEARFFVPVRPDQPYRVTACWMEARRSASNPSRGVASLRITTRDATGTEAMRCGVTFIVATRR